jgi:hypothetical protein
MKNTLARVPAEGFSPPEGGAGEIVLPETEDAPWGQPVFRIEDLGPSD